MKKVLALLLSMALVTTQISTVFAAEFTFDDFVNAATANNSFKDTIDLSRISQVEDGRYYAIDYNDEKCPFDISKAFRNYSFVTTEAMNLADYDNTGIVNYYADFIYYGMQTVYRSVAKFDDGEYYHVLVLNDEDFPDRDFPVDKGEPADEYIGELKQALDTLNAVEAAELHEAYSFAWVIKYRYLRNGEPYNRSYRLDAVYFDTDSGEYVVTYNIPEKLTDKYGEYKLYTIEEFLQITAEAYKDVEPVKEYDRLIVTEDGDEVVEHIVQVPVGTDTEEKADTEKVTEEEPENQEEQPLEEKKTEEEEISEEEQPEQEENQEEKKDEGFVKTDMSKIDVLINGKPLEFKEQEPIIVNDRVLVPLRVIFEELGADVGWNGDTQTVTMAKDGVTISLKIGAAELIKNGAVKEIDAPAQIKNERTLVPIRAISESFGNTVLWDGDNRIVEIE